MMLRVWVCMHVILCIYVFSRSYASVADHLLHGREPTTINSFRTEKYKIAINGEMRKYKGEHFASRIIPVIQCRIYRRDSTAVIRCRYLREK